MIPVQQSLRAKDLQCEQAMLGRIVESFNHSYGPHKGLNADWNIIAWQASIATNKILWILWDDEAIETDILFSLVIRDIDDEVHVVGEYETWGELQGAIKSAQSMLILLA